jgi:hypothetical protein
MCHWVLPVASTATGTQLVRIPFLFETLRATCPHSSNSFAIQRLEQACPGLHFGTTQFRLGQMWSVAGTRDLPSPLLEAFLP